MAVAVGVFVFVGAATLLFAFPPAGAFASTPFVGVTDGVAVAVGVEVSAGTTA